MARVRSWWQLKKVRHRDAVILSTLSSAFLLAGELLNQTGLPLVYELYLAPVENQPLLFAFNLLLSVLAFTTVFGGVLVLIGGVHFLWGRVARGRLLLGLGVGLSAIGLARQVAYYTLALGSPVVFFTLETGTPVGLGVLLGVASDILMGEYAMMLKKHAKSAWRQWRKARRPRPSRRRVRGYANGRN